MNKFTKEEYEIIKRYLEGELKMVSAKLNDLQGDIILQLLKGDVKDYLKEEYEHYMNAQELLKAMLDDIRWRIVGLEDKAEVDELKHE